MNKTAAIRVLATTTITNLLAACATAKPISEWRSEDFSGKLNNILVIGVTSRSTRRRVFEDNFVKGLAANGTSAVPSYTLLESSIQLTRKLVERAIEGQGLDGVLVTRLVGIKEKETFRLPANYDDDGDYISYYDHAWRQSSRGYYSEHKVFTLETSLYEVASAKLVWRMQSQAMDVSQPQQIIRDQITLTIKTLTNGGLI